MKRGSLVRATQSETLYMRSEPHLGRVNVDEIMTVIEGPPPSHLLPSSHRSSADRFTLVLHPRLGMGKIYTSSLGVVDETG